MFNYLNRISPEEFNSLNENEILVFPSNLSGIHGKGLAKVAFDNFGAVWGKGIGLYGQTYAIPTKDYNVKSRLSITRIQKYIENFIIFANNNKNNKFLVSKIGCGYSGYTPIDIAPLFVEAIDVDNIHLPLEFWNELIKLKKYGNN